MTTALALDTTSDTLSVALHQEGRPAASHYAPAGTRTTATIFGVIEKLLAGAGLAPEALEVFIVARGPGSFTGTRIGLAVAKTFARVLGCPLIGVDTLRLLAAQTEPVEERPFHALLNCVRDEAYHAPFRWRDGRLEYADWWNHNGMLSLQIETLQAATNARQLGKPGVDCFTWGPADLSFDLEAHPDHPLKTVDDCLLHVLKQLEGTDIKVSFRNGTPDQRDKYREMGVTVFMERPRA